jgi:hypothetical protein
MTQEELDGLTSLPIPRLRKAVRDNLKIDPAQMDAASMIKALHDKFGAKPAAAARGGKPPAAAAKPTTLRQLEGQRLVDTSGWPPGLAEHIAQLSLRVATLEQAAGVAAGSKMPASPATDDRYAALQAYMVEAADGTPVLKMEVTDVDILNEEQVHLLASLLDEPIDNNGTPVAIRLLKTRCKAKLDKLYKDSQASATARPAQVTRPAASSAPRPAAWKEGDIVSAVEDGELKDPVRIIYIEGKEFMAHDPDDQCGLLPLSAIKGRSSKKWPHAELTREDFEE